MQETAEARLKRMLMRSWRRGTKEMDLILGPWAEVQLVQLDEAGLELYDALLAENDQDLMAWILGHDAPPARFAGLLQRIASHARTHLGSAGS